MQIDRFDNNDINHNISKNSLTTPEPTDEEDDLIVDDHADIRRLIRMTLEFKDYQIHEAVDGDAALLFIATVRPDVVLLGVMMLGTVDDLQTCRRRIKADPVLTQ